MQRYTLVAQLGSSLTSVPISARCDEFAIAMAAKEVNAKFVSDKRWEIGEIKLTRDNDKKCIIFIKENENENLQNARISGKDGTPAGFVDETTD